MAWFRTRTVDHELEARLEAPGADGASGKVERKRYGDGSGRFKLKARGLDVPDGTVVAITIAGRPVTELAVRDGRLKIDLQDGPGETVPEAVAGETLRILKGEEILVSGNFQRE